MTANDQQLPKRIRDRLKAIETEINDMVEKLEYVPSDKLKGRLAFKFSGVGLRTFLSDSETAQAICFVTRYDSLPTVCEVKGVEKDGEYHLENLAFIRHVLNDYRSLIQNKSDSVYYGNIHKLCREKLLNTKPHETVAVRVFHEDKTDVTKEFARFLDGEHKAIKQILGQLEFGYIYNGILQHSDECFTDRFWEDYRSGELNYIFIKHARLLGFIKGSLAWHYNLLGSITFVKRGGL